MLQFKPNSVKGYKNKDIPYSILSKTEKSKGLAIVFPGAGYTVQSPLLHYSTGLFLDKSYDVLHVNYPYNDKFYDSFTSEEFSEAIQFDSKTVLDQVLKDNNVYDEYCLIGKSIGTIALSYELKRPVFQSAKAVWMTPLLSNDVVFDAMVNSTNKGISFIGDNDRFYIADRYKEILQKPNITFKLIPGVNHILEYDDNVFGSLDVLGNVISEIDQF